MSKEEEKAGGFKIQDKRRFDSSGEARDQGADKKSASPLSDQAKSAAEKKGGAEFDVRDSTPPTIDFSSYVVSLATTALMHLGAMRPPEGVQLEVNRDAAKQMIDIIEMLQVKTRGNLEENEKGLLDEVLHNLRLAYLKVK